MRVVARSAHLLIDAVRTCLDFRSICRSDLQETVDATMIGLIQVVGKIVVLALVGDAIVVEVVGANFYN